MNRFRHFLLLSFGLILLFTACEEAEKEEIQAFELSEVETSFSPNGFAPLSASLRFNTSQAASVEVRVPGKHGSDSDLIRKFPELRENFDIPIIGLYPDQNNEVELTFFNENGDEIATESFNFETRPLIPEMPEIRIDVPAQEQTAEGWSLVNYFGFTTEIVPQRTLMFDKYGDIRWYVNFKGHPQLRNLFFDYGMQQLRNGNLIFGNGSDGTLYEINFLGEIVNSWSLQGYGFHHTVIEKPNGNFLVTVNDFSKETLEDVIIEVDRNSGNIANVWDLTVSLDEKRRALFTDRADLDIDWFHANGLAYSEDDDCIIVSGRTQCVVKLTAENEVVWILAPHRDWETAGNGANLNDFLLQPLDANGTSINDQQVLDGTTNHPDFEWNWYQHSPILKPDGNLMLFDNGDFRNYEQTDYSRAVEYRIDEANKTVQQIWQYGKERREELYSPITSNVIYDEASDRVIFNPGSTNNSGNEYGKTIEIDYQSRTVAFEASVIAPRTTFRITFHNVQRVRVD